MHRPRIGIPLSLDNQGRWRQGRHYHYIDRRYADAIDQAGGRPLQIPIQSDPAAAAGDLDGLVLPGGDDFPSDRTLPESVELDLVPDEQRVFDAALYQAARERGIPVLGICYGMQLMVHVSGGSLEPHLPSGHPECAEHRLPEADRHGVEVVSGSLLSSVVGAGARWVNSLHHQAVRDAGAAFRVVARSADGVIEAIEATSPISGAANGTDSAWEIGVQWHPEKMDEDESRRLFAAFVEACRARRATAETSR